jgi:thiol-disulfide isomerase/thioredoxin
LNLLVLLARLALCAVFAIAAMRKLPDRSGVANGLTGFGVSQRFAPPLATLLIASELTLAAALLVDESAAAGAVGAVALLAIFTGVLAASIARGKRPACPCFGAGDRRPIGWDTVARNIALIGLGAFVAARAGEAPLLATIGASVRFVRPQTIYGTLPVLCLALLAILTFAGWLIVRQQGRILLRLESLERSIVGDPQDAAAAPAGGLAVGSAAPPFSLATLDGNTESLAGLDALGRPILLVFAHPACGPCNALLPEVARWQREYSSALTIAIVSEGTVAENREKAEAGLRHILLQREREVADSYQAYGTPGAVLVEHGRIASPLAQGSGEIRALVTGFFDGRPHAGLAIGDALPDISLETASGAPAMLRDAIAEDRETVLLFWNPGCGFCSKMIGDLLAWERRRRDGDTRLAIVSSADPDESLAGMTSPVFIDRSMHAASAFAARGTPMAVRIDKRGRVASKVIAGREAVLGLLELEMVSA